MWSEKKENDITYTQMVSVSCLFIVFIAFRMRLSSQITRIVENKRYAKIKNYQFRKKRKFEFNLTRWRIICYGAIAF